MKWFPGLTIERAEKMCIEQAMEFYHGNKTLVSKSIGIAIRTLDSKLEQYAKENKEMDAKDEERKRKEDEFSLRSRGLLQTQSRPQVEPPNEIGKKQTVPLYVGKEVQKVPSKPSPSGPPGSAGRPNTSGSKV